MPTNGYFNTIFAIDGDKAAVPNGLDPGGLVSYDQGYPAGYEIPPGDPGSLPVERNKMNQLFFDLTSAMQYFQQGKAAAFITSAMNLGTPFSYSKADRVLLGGVVYTSLIDLNTDTPPTANWTTGTPVTIGGTGLTTLAAHYILVGAGTSAVSLIAPSAASGIPLISQGVSSDPLYGTTAIAGGGTGQTTALAAFDALKQSATTSYAGVSQLATNANVQTGTSTTLVPSVAAMRSHLGMSQAWVSFSLTGSISDAYNVSSVTDTSTSIKVINLTSAMDNANYGATITQVQSAPSTYDPNMTITGRTTSALTINNYDELNNLTGWVVNIFGRRS